MVDQLAGCCVPFGRWLFFFLVPFLVYNLELWRWGQSDTNSLGFLLPSLFFGQKFGYSNRSRRRLHQRVYDVENNVINRKKVN
jgi:hypothetical protein